MLILTLAGLLLGQVPAPPPATDAYTLGPDSIRQLNVPQGRVEGPFMQDGSDDLDNQHGNWPLANQSDGSRVEVQGLRLSLRLRG